MKLKRIAALGAVVLSPLASSTTALASTASSPPYPAAVAVTCPSVRLIPEPAAAAVVRAKAVPAKAVPAKVVPAKVVPAKAVLVGPAYPVRAVSCCGPLKPGRGIVHRVCPSAALVFDMPAWSRTLTEVHGPRLSVHETLLYRGGLYTVMSVRGGMFTLDLRGKPFVNRGRAIRDGHALILRDVVVLYCIPRPSTLPCAPVHPK